MCIFRYPETKLYSILAPSMKINLALQWQAWAARFSFIKQPTDHADIEKTRVHSLHQKTTIMYSTCIQVLWTSLPDRTAGSWRVKPVMMMIPKSNAPPPAIFRLLQVALHFFTQYPESTMALAKNDHPGLTSPSLTHAIVQWFHPSSHLWSKPETLRWHNSEWSFCHVKSCNVH